MTDPFSALESFQEALTNDVLSLQQGSIDPELFVHPDHPNGSTRLTYCRLDRRTVTALVMFVLVEPLEGTPCFQIGYAYEQAADDVTRSLQDSALMHSSVGLPRSIHPPPSGEPLSRAR
jgi:hypothetical protein